MTYPTKGRMAQVIAMALLDKPDGWCDVEVEQLAKKIVKKHTRDEIISRVWYELASTITRRSRKEGGEWEGKERALACLKSSNIAGESHSDELE